MRTAADLIMLAALAVTAGVTLVVLFVAGRRAVRALFSRKVEARIRRAQEILARHHREQFAGMDRLLFQLGEVQDLAAVEAALGDLLDRGTNAERLRLRKVYDSLGITDRYLRDLRSAPRWVDRAAAARALGQLAVVQAIPLLLESMRDPHEDGKSVKLAAAQALGDLKVPEAIPLLVAELGTRDQWASPRVAEVLTEFGALAIPELLRALEDEANTNLRVWAAQILGKLGDGAAVLPLITRLRDRAEQVRISVAEALGRIRDRRAVNDLVQVSLRDPVPPVRAEAARALGLIGDEDAARSLVLLLSDPDYWTRLRVVEAIELLRPTDVTVLDAALRDSSREVRMRAAVALERIGVLEQRAADLESDDRGVVERAHRTLLEMGRAGLIESLLSLTEHQSFRLRSRIAEVLGEIGEPKAVQALVPLLSDPVWPVRLRAVEAIGRLRPPNAVEILVKALADPEESVRGQAVLSIRAVGPPADDSSLDRVVALFDTANAEVRASVVEAVGHLARPAIDALLHRALVDPNDEVRLGAVKAITPRVSDEWITVLEGCLAAGSTELRVAAARALGQVGTPNALRGLVASIATPVRTLREVITDTLAKQGVGVISLLKEAPQGIDTSLGIAWTLGKTGDPAALEHLGEMVGRPEPELRAAVAGALGKIRHPRSAELLSALIRDRNERVRAAAVNALGAVGGPGMIALLAQAAEDPDTFVRHRVPVAIGRVGGTEALAALEALERKVTDEETSCRLAIGFGLTGQDRGLERALEALRDPSRRRRVEALIAQEMPDTARAFRLQLQLPDRRSEDLSRLDPTALSAQYAAALRGDQSSNQRLLAVRALRAMGAAIHADVLIDAVRTDPESEVRRTAIESLASEPASDETARVFVDALRDPALPVQIAAARALAGLRDANHNEALLRGFFAEQTELDHALIGALAAANGERLVAFIDELLGKNEETVLRGGARVLGQLADPRAVPLLSAWLRAPGPRLRAEAVLALGQINTEQARSAVLGCVADPHVEVRLAVVSALGSMPGPKTYAGLSDMRRDPAVAVRQALARVLGQSDELAPIALAQDLAKDPEDSVRVEALLALARLGGSDGILAFNKAHAEQSDAVRRALATIGREHPSARAAHGHLRTAPQPEARAAALAALRSLGALDDADLEAALVDPTPEVRIAAIEAADLALHRAVLERLLRDPDARVRDAVRRRRLSLVSEE
ncbi:MAG: HEAT repeat domain-containing protein [Deltaproteobacteria bacterium]|nr:HEAT repeat domain-containing protein [Deltaproteobacteria bacterium]